MRNIFDEASKTCLGMQKTRIKKEWITPDTWQAIEERRQLKKKISDSRSARLRVRYRAAYAKTNRRVKRKIRTDKKAHMEELAKEADSEAAQKVEQRNVYKVTKLICEKYSGSRNAPIRDNILRAYGILSHVAEVIKSYWDNFSCSVGDGGILFEVHTGVRQGCVMSTLLFNFVEDWIMQPTAEDQIRGIRWTPSS